MSSNSGEAQAEQRPVRQFFTNRHGGVSQAPYSSFNLGDHVGDDPAAVAANRARLAKVCGLEPSQIVWMEQIHSNTVTVVGPDHPAIIEATDAIVTKEPNLALAVLTADCVPLLLADPEHEVVAAVHAGRLGARNGIVQKTVNTMVELGATPETIHVYMGVAASGRHYEVPPEMAADVEAKLPGSRVETVKGTTGIDVRRGLTVALYEMGVTNLFVDPRCTIEDKDFFSYRREGKTGRQAALIWRVAETASQ